MKRFLFPGFLIHDDKHSPLHFKRLQFPIRVSFAMSINKAQGQSLKIAGIDLEQSCFSHGQLLWPPVVEATILTGCFQNEEVFIPQIPLIHDDKHSPLHFKRLQFPIQVSLAISIKKAQEATILTGCFQNEEVFIPRIPLNHDDKHSPLHFKRLQFPIRVSFAMSIKKAQEVLIPRIPLIHDDKHSPLHYKRLQFPIRVSFAMSIKKAQEATILTGCFQNEEVFIPRIPLVHDDKHSPLHFKRLQFPIQVSLAMSIKKAQEATILTGCFQNEEVFIPRIPLIHDDKHSPLHFKRLQFPIRVSFAMSIKKAQGQSLKITGIDLEQPCFSHGQLYVDCSRVGSGRNIYVLAPENKTSNFVYSSVFS
ncbi:hypothetical protein LAZ67_11001044 [Cordylochernes scorpioides]|uniref:Uncharacterized protein n=1 Tax=Cordylochernes scorpioides TaxID=51811 RepID=A0ABY6KY74_9ARAC|nr:hypothetical protein LAZ67_11001044 [Cordylochernes scorpioides]